LFIRLAELEDESGINYVFPLDESMATESRKSHTSPSITSISIAVEFAGANGRINRSAKLDPRKSGLREMFAAGTARASNKDEKWYKGEPA